MCMSWKESRRRRTYMAQVSSNSRCSDNIVACELIDFRGELQEKWKRLSDSSGGSQHGYLGIGRCCSGIGTRHYARDSSSRCCCNHGRLEQGKEEFGWGCRKRCSRRATNGVYNEQLLGDECGKRKVGSEPFLPILVPVQLLGEGNYRIFPMKANKIAIPFKRIPTNNNLPWWLFPIVHSLPPSTLSCTGRFPPSLFNGVFSEIVSPFLVCQLFPFYKLLFCKNHWLLWSRIVDAPNFWYCHWMLMS